MHKMDEHISDNTRHVEGVRLELQVMRENHLSHMEKALESQAVTAIQNERRFANMETLSTRTATNQEWLMKYHWIVATSSIGALVASLLGLIT